MHMCVHFGTAALTKCLISVLVPVKTPCVSVPLQCPSRCLYVYLYFTTYYEIVCCRYILRSCVHVLVLTIESVYSLLTHISQREASF
jgi:hypothetical protein